MGNKYKYINLAEKLAQFSETWSPKVIAELNDYQLKLARLKGEFVWHKHDDSDEAFIVLDGKLTIHFRDGQVNLEKGEIYVVPKGIEHKPVAVNECRILLIEPRGIVNTGDIQHKHTARNDVWI
jgi:mannose-6-phosphate isomerase-like protein (cupin superfamily)